MRLVPSLLLLCGSTSVGTAAFHVAPPRLSSPSSSRAAAFIGSSSSSSSRVASFGRPVEQRARISSSSLPSVAGAGLAAAPSSIEDEPLGLITFDLDDTLYPIAPVLEEANLAFSRAMDRYGYSGVTRNDILDTMKIIRQEMESKASADAKAPLLSHTEVRLLAIRAELEKFVLNKKLKETAVDWATDVDDLNPVVVKFAKDWAHSAVDTSVVLAVYNAWEMERHHSAERHLYPEVLEMLQKLKDDHPGVVIGAVTDGRANPMLMVHTLGPYFDFTVSWEDGVDNVRKSDRDVFTDALDKFKELQNVDKTDDLAWIYKNALDMYRKTTKCEDKTIAAAPDGGSGKGKVWVHVGDDLAYDVGGSKTCGAVTILTELDEDQYGQTARKMLEPNGQRPVWSAITEEEMVKHQAMADGARTKVDGKVNRLSALPRTINKILEQVVSMETAAA